MEKTLRTLSAVVVFLALLIGKTQAQDVPRMELGANYNYVRTNAPPGDCGCFSMNGGAGWFAFNFTHSLSLVGEVGSVHASDIEATTADLTLTSYLVGPRYSLKHVGPVTPFAQILIGGAHASGDSTTAGPALTQSQNSFALTAGGGVDIRLTQHWALRAAQVDYYLTRFSNGVNDHQNNLRISAGIVLRFGGK